MTQGHFLQFEDRVQRLIEDGFARLFAGHLHPREVAIRLARAMEDHTCRSSSGQLVAPDVYSIRLNPQDQMAILGVQPDASAILADELIRVARGVEISFTSSPEVKLLADGSIRPHQMEVTAWFATVSADTTQSMKSDKAQEEQGPPCLVAALILNGTQHIPLDRPILNLGRHRDNHIIIDDPGVSRHHAQIRLRFGKYVLFDLGSSGGITINGQPVQEATLQSGDVIMLAHSSLIYVEESSVSPRPSTDGDPDTSPLT